MKDHKDHVDSVCCEDSSTAELVRYLEDNNLVSDRLYIYKVKNKIFDSVVLDLETNIPDWGRYFGKDKEVDTDNAN